MKLNEMNRGQTCRVTGLPPEASTARRLETLGIAVGAAVRLMQKKRDGGVIMRAGGTRIALGGSIAAQTTVSADG